MLGCIIQQEFKDRAVLGLRLYNRDEVWVRQPNSFSMPRDCGYDLNA